MSENKKEITKKKRGRNKQYTAEEYAKRRKASSKKYYARKKAVKNLQKAQTEYEAAKQAYLAEAGGTARDAYYANKDEWEEFASSNGSDLAEYMDRYGYDESVLDAYREMQRSGDKSLEHVAKKLLELMNVSEAAANFYVASENLVNAEKQHIEVFSKALNAWL